MKRFSIEGRVECGFSELVLGKVAAFHAVVTEEKCYGLGLAIANEPGYHLIPPYWCHSDNFEEMKRHAAELNQELFKLDSKGAAIIICSTMFRK